MHSSIEVFPETDGGFNNSDAATKQSLMVAICESPSDESMLTSRPNRMHARRPVQPLRRR
jgi:hypothetical protein